MNIIYACYHQQVLLTRLFEQLAVLKRAYMRTPWFWLSLVIIFCGIVEIPLWLSWHSGLLSLRGESTVLMRVVSGLPLLRQLHALEVRLHG